MLRERVGLSQAALAQEAGASQSQVHGYEKGASTPGTGTLARILSAMGADFADLERALREVRGEPVPATNNGNPPPLLEEARAARDATQAVRELETAEVDQRLARMIRIIWGLDRDGVIELLEFFRERDRERERQGRSA